MQIPRRDLPSIGFLHTFNSVASIPYSCILRQFRRGPSGPYRSGGTTLPPPGPLTPKRTVAAVPLVSFGVLFIASAFPRNREGRSSGLEAWTPAGQPSEMLAVRPDALGPRRADRGTAGPLPLPIEAACSVGPGRLNQGIVCPCPIKAGPEDQSGAGILKDSF